MESTAWTTDIGAKARAATWKNQAPVATAMPMANHLDLKSSAAGAQRMAHVDLRRRVGAAVLVEEAELRGDSAGEREQDSKVHHGIPVKIGGAARYADVQTGL